MNRNGKIANLPATLIEQLNIRLDEGFSGPQILNWLNNHKETRKVLKEDFDGVPISKQNLSQWRNGGYQEWRVRNDFDHYIYSSCAKSLDLRRDQDINLVADYLAAEVAALYAKFLATWDGQPTKKAEAQLRVLRGLNRDIALLQKTMERADQHMIAHEKAEEKRIEKMVDEAFIDGLRKGMREAQSNQVKVETPVKPQEEENSQDTDPEEDTEETEPETPADAVNGEEPENSPEPLTQHPSEPKNVTQLSSVTPVAPGYSLPTTRA